MTAKNTQQPNSSQNKTGSPREHVAARWRWYHFYFILAMFDVLVIVASLTLYHSTLVSYRTSLDSLAEIDEAQQWLASLRLSVTQLNAPGNDVFATRLIEDERGRFEETRTRYKALIRREEEYDINLSAFRSHIQHMIREELRIFDIFAKLQNNPIEREAERNQINQATSFMASMDRYQANALEALAVAAERLSERQHHLLEGYGEDLERSASIEKYFLAIVVLILIGVFWYGRKLQAMHDRLMWEQQRAAEEKHARLAAVGEVCSAVAHGMRNPLAAIASSAQLALEYGTLDDATKLRVQDVFAESKRLDERIRRLLDFSNAQEQSFEQCDIVQVIRGALREIQPKLDEHGVRVTFDDPGELFVIRGDREWLSQGVIEIVSNAMDHLPDGGEVHIDCNRSPDLPNHLRVDICDNGPGIPESIRDNVFDLFFTSKSEGNGIGLASVKRVVDMHGGRIALGPPMNGTGTTIRIELPLTSSKI